MFDVRDDLHGLPVLLKLLISDEAYAGSGAHTAYVGLLKKSLDYNVKM
jgi:hypothetical protein